VVVTFLDAHKDAFGVEPICRVLRQHNVATIAPSTYYAARSRPPSTRSVRDEQLLVQIRRVHADRSLGRGLYGAVKVWRQLHRENIMVARCTVERLMRSAGLRGARRGRRFVTTRPDSAAARPPDRVHRNFSAERPNALWVVDFTYVPCWSGMRFTAFVSDVFSRRIVGWRTAATMPTELPLDALEMALWIRSRNGESVDGLIHHSDAGAQLRFNGSSQHRGFRSHGSRLVCLVDARFAGLFLTGADLVGAQARSRVGGSRPRSGAERP